VPDTAIDLNLRGLRLRAHASGPANGAPCLLLHGWLDTSSSFSRLAPLLQSAPAQTFSYDARGHGDSDWVGAGGFYHFSEYIADLDAALDALGLALPAADGTVAAPVRLVGHSMGASVALLYAAVRPARVAHLSLLDGLPMLVKPSEVPGRLVEYLDDLKSMPRNRRAVNSIEHGAERLRKTSPFLQAEASLLLAQAGISPDPAQENRLAWKWDPWLRAHSPLPFTEEMLGEILPLIRAPALLIRAGNTWLPEEAELRERLAKLSAPLDIQTIPDTSHHLHIESAGQVSRAILQAWSIL